MVASPLALKLWHEKDARECERYLSSVEVCHVANGDFLEMQNVGHLNAALSYLNRRPYR